MDRVCSLRFSLYSGLAELEIPLTGSRRVNYFSLNSCPSLGWVSKKGRLVHLSPVYVPCSLVPLVHGYQHGCLRCYFYPKMLNWFVIATYFTQPLSIEICVGYLPEIDGIWTDFLRNYVRSFCDCMPTFLLKPIPKYTLTMNVLFVFRIAIEFYDSKLISVNRFFFVYYIAVSICRSAIFLFHTWYKISLYQFSAILKMVLPSTSISFRNLPNLSENTNF